MFVQGQVIQSFNLGNMEFIFREQAKQQQQQQTKKGSNPTQL